MDWDKLYLYIGTYTGGLFLIILIGPSQACDSMYTVQ